MDVNEYIKKLKEKEAEVNELVREINKYNTNITNIEMQISKLDSSNKSYIDIALWNEKLDKIEVESRTVVYDHEEYYVHTKGDFEYFNEIPVKYLIMGLEEKKNIILDKINKTQQRLDLYVNEN